MIVERLGQEVLPLFDCWSPGREIRTRFVGARRDAQEARERAELQAVLLQEQLDCTAGLQAESDAALLAYLVALSSGDGAEVARVDAQQATNRWVEARERCSG